MGLNLIIFSEEKEELESLDFGAYSDYGRLIDHVVKYVEGGVRGSKCPTLVLHSDCDGEWTVEECRTLKQDIGLIKEAFLKEPPATPVVDWQVQVAKEFELNPANLYESFFDLNGDLVFDRLMDLADLAIRERRPIVFQ